MIIQLLFKQLKDIINGLEKENVNYITEEEKTLKEYICNLNYIENNNFLDEFAKIRSLVIQIKRLTRRIPIRPKDDSFWSHITNNGFRGLLFQHIIQWLKNTTNMPEYSAAFNVYEIISASKKSNLTYLDISNLNISYNNLIALSRLTHISHLNLCATKFDGKYIGELSELHFKLITNTLEKMTALINLNLSNNLIGRLNAEFIKHLSCILSDLPLLSDLNLSNNNIRDCNPGLQEMFIEIINEPCDIILLEPNIMVSSLSDIPINSNRGYLIIGNNLYYANKVSEYLFDFSKNLTAENIKSITNDFSPTNRPRTLSEKEYNEIQFRTERYFPSDIYKFKFPALKNLNLSGNLLRFNEFNTSNPLLQTDTYRAQLNLLQQLHKLNIKVDFSFNYINFLDEKTLNAATCPLFLKYKNFDPLLKLSNDTCERKIESLLNPGFYVSQSKGVTVIANLDNHAQILTQTMDPHLQLSLMKYHIREKSKESTIPFIKGLQYTETFIRESHSDIDINARSLTSGNLAVLFDADGIIDQISIKNLNTHKGKPLFINRSKIDIAPGKSLIHYNIYAPSNESQDSRALIIECARLHLEKYTLSTWTNQTIPVNDQILVKMSNDVLNYYVGQTSGEITQTQLPLLKSQFDINQLRTHLKDIVNIILSNGIPLIPLKLPLCKRKINGEAITADKYLVNEFFSSKAQAFITQIDITDFENNKNKYSFFNSEQSKLTYSKFFLVDNSLINKMHDEIRQQVFYGLTEGMRKFLLSTNEELLNCYRYCIKMFKILGIDIPEPFFLIPIWGLTNVVDQTPLHLSFASFFGHPERTFLSTKPNDNKEDIKLHLK